MDCRVRMGIPLWFIKWFNGISMNHIITSVDMSVKFMMEMVIVVINWFRESDLLVPFNWVSHDLTQQNGYHGISWLYSDMI